MEFSIYRGEGGVAPARTTPKLRNSLITLRNTLKHSQVYDLTKEII